MFDGAVCLPVCTLLQFLQQGENSMRCHLSTAVAWSKQMARIHANLFNSPYFVCDTTSEIEIIEMVCMCSDYRLRDLKQKRVPQFRVTSQEESASVLHRNLRGAVLKRAAIIDSLMHSVFYTQYGKHHASAETGSQICCMKIARLPMFQ